MNCVVLQDQFVCSVYSVMETKSVYGLKKKVKKKCINENKT